jgi:hypothetical protein
MDPSPTADATRFTLPERMSPTAKTRGRLVSRRSGARVIVYPPSPSQTNWTAVFATAMVAPNFCACITALAAEICFNPGTIGATDETTGGLAQNKPSGCQNSPQGPNPGPLSTSRGQN